MYEVQPYYAAGSGIRPPRRAGKVRGVAREVVPGGGLELWHCDHDHAPGVRDCRQLTQSQRDEAQQCAAAWLHDQISRGFIAARPVLTEDEDEARQAADAIVIPPPGADHYDPVPDLAALIDGLHRVALQGDRDSCLAMLADLLAGPYARLRGGLLLDEPGREDQPAEDAIREALNAAQAARIVARLEGS